MELQILHKQELPLGGFAGLKEHRLIVDQRVGGQDNTWDGLGSFVYLADARFLPHGETRMHGHHEIDVISVLVEGQIVHEGSLEHGRSMGAGQAQAQRAGGEGFQHNEINPDAQQNRMLQLWALPETPGEPASYKFYDLVLGKVTRIYGGDKNQSETLDSQTYIDVGLLAAKQSLSKDGEFLLYMATGDGQLNDQLVTEGDLVRGNDLRFTAKTAAQIIVITTTLPA